jgi:hypothetical protein
VQRIDAIAVDYFGTSVPQYELGERFIQWWSALGPYQGWMAVSATTLHLAQGRWDPALEHKPENVPMGGSGEKAGGEDWLLDPGV